MPRISIFFLALMIANIANAEDKKPLNPIDFFVDGKKMAGQQVTVGECLFVAANQRAVYCRSQKGGGVDIMVDMETLEPEAQRRSLHECDLNGANKKCTGFVEGTVVVSGNRGAGLKDAKIRWTR